MVREEVVELTPSEFWKAEADRMLQMHGWGNDDDESSIEEPLPKDEDPFLSIEDEESAVSPDSGSDYFWSKSITGEGELIRVEVDI